MMKPLFLLPLLTGLVFPFQDPTPPPDGSQIAVLSFKWTRGHQTTDKSGPDKPLPARAVTQADKNWNRTARVNDPAGVRDPNADTLDNRQAELEKNVRSAEKSQPKTVDAFTYQAKIQNTSKQTVEIVFWEYQFIDPANAGNVTRRQFLCGINLKPGKEKDLLGTSLSGPTDVVSVGNLADKSTGQFQEKAVINRVEFADGKNWMRKDWNANEIKAGYQRAMATPWSPNEVCRAL